MVAMSLVAWVLQWPKKFRCTNVNGEMGGAANVRTERIFLRQVPENERRKELGAESTEIAQTISSCNGNWIQFNL